ncbi:MAG TPA: hypothetical protein VF215_09015 [Thermoanaerobaculia bacterium]
MLPARRGQQCFTHPAVGNLSGREIEPVLEVIEDDQMLVPAQFVEDRSGQPLKPLIVPRIGFEQCEKLPIAGGLSKAGVQKMQESIDGLLIAPAFDPDRASKEVAAATGELGNDSSFPNARYSRDDVEATIG